MAKQTAQFSIRLSMELYRKLRFIAADRDKSLNQVISDILQAATEQARVSVPNDLLMP